MHSKINHSHMMCSHFKSFPLINRVTPINYSNKSEYKPFWILRFRTFSKSSRVKTNTLMIKYYTVRWLLSWNESWNKSVGHHQCKAQPWKYLIPQIHSIDLCNAGWTVLTQPVASLYQVNYFLSSQGFYCLLKSGRQHGLLFLHDLTDIRHES